MDVSLVESSFDRFRLPVPVVTVEEHSTIIWLAGEQDLSVVEALRTALLEAASAATAERQSIVIDLRGVTFIDSSSARALIDATTEIRSSLAVTLRAPSTCVRRMFDLCRGSGLLDTA